MFGGWFEWVAPFASLLLTGAVIKLLDDALDADFDKFRGERTLAVRLGPAAFPYGLVVALLAAYCDVRLAIALFFGSYAVGMFATWRERLPTRLPAFVEILLAVGLSLVLSGWRTALWALAMMAVIDWLDDLVDSSRDKVSGQANLVLRVGLVPTLFLVLAALCLAVLLNPVLTALTFIAVTLLTMVAETTTKHLWKTHEQDGSVEP